MYLTTLECAHLPHYVSAHLRLSRPSTSQYICPFLRITSLAYTHQLQHDPPVSVYPIPVYHRPPLHVTAQLRMSPSTSVRSRPSLKVSTLLCMARSRPRHFLAWKLWIALARNTSLLQLAGFQVGIIIAILYHSLTNLRMATATSPARGSTHRYTVHLTSAWPLPLLLHAALPIITWSTSPLHGPRQKCIVVTLLLVPCVCLDDTLPCGGVAAEVKRRRWSHLQRLQFFSWKRSSETGYFKLQEKICKNQDISKSLCKWNTPVVI